MVVMTIQMQMQMMDDAANAVEEEYNAYGYVIAGSFNVMNNANLQGDRETFGYITESNLEDRIDSSDTYCEFYRRGNNYEALFDPEDGFMQVTSEGTSCIYPDPYGRNPRVGVVIHEMEGTGDGSNVNSKRITVVDMLHRK
jgi:hypothetical protein